MRLLFLGDVVGRSGRDAIAERLPGLITDYSFDFVVINGENASHGRGLTEGHFAEQEVTQWIDADDLGDGRGADEVALRLTHLFVVKEQPAVGKDAFR